MQTESGESRRVGDRNLAVVDFRLTRSLNPNTSRARKARVSAVMANVRKHFRIFETGKAGATVELRLPFLKPGHRVPVWTSKQNGIPACWFTASALPRPPLFILRRLGSTQE